MPRSTRDDRVGYRRRAASMVLKHGALDRECLVESNMMFFRVVKRGFAGAS